MDRLAVCAPEVFPDGKTADDVLSGYEISLVWSLFISVIHFTYLRGLPFSLADFQGDLRLNA